VNTNSGHNGCTATDYITFFTFIMLSSKGRVHDDHIEPLGAKGGKKLPRIRLHQLNILYLKLLQKN
jgi:hypothetical protein